MDSIVKIVALLGNANRPNMKDLRFLICKLQDGSDCLRIPPVLGSAGILDSV